MIHIRTFFIFQGNESKAHFYRKDIKLNLCLSQLENSSSYEFENISSNFWFSWPEFTINDTSMLVVHNGVTMSNINFTDFRFISPILEIYEYNPDID